MKEEKTPVKQIVLEAIERSPDECSIDDIMYRVYVIDKVLKGLVDVKDGRTYTQEEMEKRMVLDLPEVHDGQ